MRIFMEDKALKKNEKLGKGKILIEFFNHFADGNSD